MTARRRLLLDELHRQFMAEQRQRTTPANRQATERTLNRHREEWSWNRPILWTRSPLAGAILQTVLYALFTPEQSRDAEEVYVRTDYRTMIYQRLPLSALWAMRLHLVLHHLRKRTPLYDPETARHMQRNLDHLLKALRQRNCGLSRTVVAALEAKAGMADLGSLPLDRLHRSCWSMLTPNLQAASRLAIDPFPSCPAEIVVTALPDAPGDHSYASWVLHAYFHQALVQLIQPAVRMLTGDDPRALADEVADNTIRAVGGEALLKSLAVLRQHHDVLLPPATVELVRRPEQHTLWELAQAGGWGDGPVPVETVAWLKQTTILDCSTRTARRVLGKLAAERQLAMRPLSAMTHLLEQMGMSLETIVAGRLPAKLQALLLTQLLQHELRQAAADLARGALAKSSANWTRAVPGQYWAAYPAWWEFLHNELDMGPAPPADDFRHAGAGWWWPEDDYVIISEPPVEVHLREDGTPHCETGPAVRYADGTTVWAIEGVLVDRQIVMAPQTQETWQLTSEPNEEVRRLRIERYGWDRYLAEVGAEQLDQRENVVDGTLELLVRTPDRWVLLLGTCATTGRMYAMRVDDHCQTCEQAQAFRAGRAGNCVAAG